jgi:hypothetical protein
MPLTRQDLDNLIKALTLDDWQRDRDWTTGAGGARLAAAAPIAAPCSHDCTNE